MNQLPDQSELILQLIELAKSISEKTDNYRIVSREYTSLSYDLDRLI